MTKPSQLAALILSDDDDPPVEIGESSSLDTDEGWSKPSDIIAEKARELTNAYERVEDLQDALEGMIGLVQLLSQNRDLPASLREAIENNHRVTDAQDLLS